MSNKCKENAKWGFKCEYDEIDIHENTQQVFKLKENVENFIAAVSEYGVPRHKLFAVNDLFEGANILTYL